MLKAKCNLAKSDSLVGCQIVILNVKRNTEVLSPVNIMQSNFSMLLPSDDGEFLVTARGTVYRDTVYYTERFDISHRFTTTDYTNPYPSNTSGK